MLKAPRPLPTPTGFSVTRTAIQRHIATLILTLTVVVLGCFSVFRLPVDLLPTITYPRIGVRIEAPGISPAVAVDEITRPLEESLSATDGVVQIYSQTQEGRVSLDLFFEPGGNVDQALNDTTATFNRARSQLPETIDQPRIFKADPSQLPVYEFALASPTLGSAQLRDFADQELARELNVIPGVAAVDVSGGVEAEIRINVNLERLQSLGLDLNTIQTAIAQRNQDVSGGRLSSGEGESQSRTVGQFATADEIRDLPLTAPGTTPPSRLVNLRDVAQVIDGTAEQRVFAYLNGNPAVKISVQKQSEANTITVIEGVKQRLQELQANGLIAPEIEMIPTLDESRFIGTAIRNVVDAGLSGAALAAIAIFLFLGSLRQTVIIVLAIPLATLITLILMGLFGFSLNIFSLGGLAVGVGSVVDNAIVMLENMAEAAQNVKTHAPTNGNSRGKMPRKLWMLQAQQSSQELESALISSTSTNVVSVLPFILVGGFFSLLFNELILTITFAAAGSLVIALTIIPMLSARLLAIPQSSGVGDWWPLRAFRQMVTQLTRGYGWLLKHVLHQRLLTIALAIAVCGGGGWWLGRDLPQEILPTISTGQAGLFASFPAGTPLDANQKVMAAATQILLDQPETEYVFSTVGGALFGNLTIENPLRSTATITLKPGTDVPAYAERVSEAFDALHLVDVRLGVSPGSVRGLILNNSPVRGTALDVILQGPNPELLAKTGREVLTVLDEKATLSRFRPDADRPQPEVQILPDWERATALGLDTNIIGQTVRAALEGTIATQVQRGDRLIDVRLQLDPASIQELDQLQSLPLFTGDRRPVQLGDIAEITTGRAPRDIQRINQRPVFIMAGDLAEGANLSAAYEEINQILETVDFPEGISRLPSAAAESNQQLQESFKVLGLLSAFLVFVVMAVQYNSLIDPLVILLTVPLALSGGILGLYLTETAIGATVVVGAVLLIGIVVNNAIIMVELANQIRQEEKLSPQMAILKAAPRRLRPILMTTLTTVLGLFPLAMGAGEGSEFLKPLGVVVFWGLSLATFLTLFIIPSFYSLLHGLSWPRRKRSRKTTKLTGRSPQPSSPSSDLVKR